MGHDSPEFPLHTRVGRVVFLTRTTKGAVYLKRKSAVYLPSDLVLVVLLRGHSTEVIVQQMKLGQQTMGSEGKTVSLGHIVLQHGCWQLKYYKLRVGTCTEWFDYILEAYFTCLPADHVIHLASVNLSI